jgi:hypothetical protein
MSRSVDLEDFTSNQLRDELSRRQTASIHGTCWYCNGSLLTHTCKHAEQQRKHGPWEFEPPSYIDSEDCMANPERYWRVSARHRDTGKYVVGCGDTVNEATQKCIANTLKQ